MTTWIAVSAEKEWEERRPYSEQKSVKDRYILVAAIDIASSAGIRNICFAGRLRSQDPPKTSRRRTYDIHGIWYSIQNGDQCPSLVD